MMFISRLVAFFSYASIVLVVFACQSLSKSEKPVPETWQEHFQLLQKQKGWHARGKIGFSFIEQDKPRLVSANLDWQKLNNRAFDMELSGPLGMGAFTIEKRPGETVLTNHKGREFKAANPEMLFWRHTGMHIPWSDLEWWMLGIPVSNKPYETEINAETHVLDSLKQSAWQIDYLSYQAVSLNNTAAAVLLPAKIKFSHRDTKATVIIRYWEVSGQ